MKRIFGFFFVIQIIAGCIIGNNEGAKPFSISKDIGPCTEKCHGINELTRAVIDVDRDQISAKLHFKELPDSILFNRNDVGLNWVEYEWRLVFDVKDDGEIDGDLHVVLSHTKKNSEEVFALAGEMLDVTFGEIVVVDSGIIPRQGYSGKANFIWEDGKIEITTASTPEKNWAALLKDAGIWIETYYAVGRKADEIKYRIN